MHRNDPQTGPILWWHPPPPPKKKKKNIHKIFIPPKNIHFSQNPQKYWNSEFQTPKNSLSLCMCENIRVPPGNGTKLSKLWRTWSLLKLFFSQKGPGYILMSRKNMSAILYPNKKVKTSQMDWKATWWHLYKQFGPRPGLSKCWTCSWSIPFDAK